VAEPIVDIPPRPRFDAFVPLRHSAYADGIGLRETTFGAAAIMAVVLLGARILRPGITNALDPEAGSARDH
jgi:hypothetical protein